MCNRERWREQLLRGVQEKLPECDLHYRLSDNGGMVLVATDGGNNALKGYYGYVISVGFSIL